MRNKKTEEWEKNLLAEHRSVIEIREMHFFQKS